MTKITDEKKQDFVASEMDDLNERHWGVKYTKNDMGYLKKYKNKIEYEETFI